METAGLVVGVVALLGLFKDCLDYLSIISIARQAGRDLDILKTKLDIETTLLLQWATRVRLLERDHDPRLDDGLIQQAVFKILQQLQILLADATKVGNRYGLENTSEGYEVLPNSAAISGRRKLNFDKSIAIVSARVRKLKLSPLNRALWVAKDKAKLEDLVANVSYFVDRLDELVPDISDGMRVTHLLMREDIQSGLPTRELVLVCDASEDGTIAAQAAIEGLETQFHENMLKLLAYPEMQSREYSISPAHKATFQWALRTPRGNQHWDDLSRWLKRETGVYWIRGKAGSGKSTLMKYLWYERRTKMLISEWAGDNPLLLASFYFWRIGTNRQHSIEGLLRSIICQILRFCPRSAPMLFPALWNTVRSRPEEMTLEMPRVQELKDVPLKMRQVDALKDVKVCFFIDGLDEFSGDYREGLDFLLTLSARPNTKVIVSSRPEPVLVDILGHRPNLRLEALTNEDISTYVHATLTPHPYIGLLIDVDATSESAANELIEDIVNKASGVFLWVVLACRSLLDGFAAYDTMSELRKRVDELPPDLEELFKYMLNKVDKRYKTQGARILRICYHHQSLGMGITIPAVGLAYLEEQEMGSARKSSMGPISDRQAGQRCVILEGRLRSRCGGLLEIRSRTSPCRCSRWSSPDAILSGSTVEFMHRTVFDFLRCDGVWSMEVLSLGDRPFNPDAALATLLLHAARNIASKRSLACIWEADESHQHYIAVAISYITASVRTCEDTAIALLLKLEQLLRDNSITGTCRNTRKGTTQQMGAKEFVFCLAVEMGLCPLVQRYIEELKYSDYKLTPCYPLLVHASGRYFVKNIYPQASAFLIHPRNTGCSLRMLKLLLPLGCNPEEKFVFHGVKVWFGELLSFEVPGDHKATRSPMQITCAAILTKRQEIQELRRLAPYVTVGNAKVEDNVAATVEGFKKEVESDCHRFNAREKSEIRTLVDSILRCSSKNANRDLDGKRVLNMSTRDGNAVPRESLPPLLIEKQPSWWEQIWAFPLFLDTYVPFRNSEPSQ